MELIEVQLSTVSIYTAVYSAELNKVLLSSRDSDTKLFIDVTTLKQIVESVPKIYETVSDNLRILKINDYKFYHKYYAPKQLFISKADQDVYIKVYLSDITGLLKEINKRHLQGEED